MIQVFCSAIALVFSIAILQASIALEIHLDDLFLAKYRLLENPQQTMKSFCEKKPHQNSRFFDCFVRYEWHQDGKWQNVCTTAKERWFFGPRYYDLILQCEIGGRPVQSLQAKWRIRY